MCALCDVKASMVLWPTTSMALAVEHTGVVTVTPINNWALNEQAQ